MKRSKLIIILMIAAAVISVAAVPAAAGRGAAGRGMRCGGRGAGPQFTLEQQEQMEQIRERYNDERVKLANRLKVIGLEMRELIAADGEPDFRGIERKMEDAAAVRLEIAKLRLRIHKEVRPILSDDQKILFDSRFGSDLVRGGRGGAGFGPGGMQCGGMGRGKDGGMGRGMGGMGRRMDGGMGRRMDGGMGCGGAMPAGAMRPGMGRPGPGISGSMMGGAPLCEQPAIEEIE